jgi:membrane-bound metal-dependent hydrolase YbcI (DUF457 family)
MLCVGAAVTGGLAPDILEPAVSSHHRSIAHSLAGGLSLANYSQKWCCREHEDCDEFSKILFACFAAGYFSHLALDLCTPRGLPLVA